MNEAKYRTTVFLFEISVNRKKSKKDINNKRIMLLLILLLVEMDKNK